MCYVIISDIHDNLPNLKTALDHANQIKTRALFVLGDITNAETLKYIADNFTNQIYLVAGNMEVCDLEQESKKYQHLTFLGRQGGIIKIGDCLVGLCHEPTLADNLIKSGTQIIFYGHTHKPFEETIPLRQGYGGQENGVKLINPGNLANVFYAPTFAVWDEQTSKLELKIL